jgi:hypothetical protein
VPFLSVSQILGIEPSAHPDLHRETYANRYTEHEIEARTKNRY